MGDRAAPLVVLDSVSRSYSAGGGLFRPRRTMQAVDQVTLALQRGEITGVVGESGCGKSTLARLITGLIAPSAGHVRFEDADLATLGAPALRAMRRRMQMVFQDPYSSIDPRFSIRDAVLEPFEVQGIGLTEAEADARVAALLTMVGLDPSLGGNYPHHLSGGQKQRVGIARALALEPSLVVLDEPTASLDVSIQAQIIALLEALHARLGLTYVFISHDLRLVRYFCTRIVVMYLGAVVEILPEPQARPRHPYTLALMASTFVPDPTRRREVQPITGEIASPYDRPPGCAFAARCPRASALCRSERPLLVETAGHAIACHHPLE
ncbi:MAG: peptide ABC transporter ATP-binding protein [Rhizobiales bacterium PAR1]|nr:MAG: peptide ABC transporter ATP-binding protein [Rhizobiales bacterium PAR1]